MGFKVVKPDEPSLKPLESSFPVLPRQEAKRLRRNAREMYDNLLPEAIRVVLDCLQSEKMEDRKWAAEKVFRQTLAATPNETTDPEETVVDGSVTSKDALRDLEKTTEDGTGALDPDAG